MCNFFKMTWRVKYHPVLPKNPLKSFLLEHPVYVYDSQLVTLRDVLTAHMQHERDLNSVKDSPQDLLHNILLLPGSSSHRADNPAAIFLQNKKFKNIKIISKRDNCLFNRDLQKIHFRIRPSGCLLSALFLIFC